MLLTTTPFATMCHFLFTSVNKLFHNGFKVVILYIKVLRTKPGGHIIGFYQQRKCIKLRQYLLSSKLYVKVTCVCPFFVTDQESDAFNQQFEWLTKQLGQTCQPERDLLLQAGHFHRRVVKKTISIGIRHVQLFLLVILHCVDG